MKSKQLKVINPVPDITLFAVNMITRGFQQKKWRKYIGFYFEETDSAYQNNFVDWCVPLPFWRKLGKTFLNKILASKKFPRLVSEKHKEFGQAVYQQSEDILRKDIKKMTNKQILSDFKRLRDSFYELCFWGVVPPAIDFENNYLTGWLENRLIQDVKKYRIKKSLQEVFSILTTPKELTYFQKESDDLLKLAAKKKITEKEIIKHRQKYCWVDYGYLGPVHTPSYYKRRITKLKKDKQSPQKKLAKITKERYQILREQKVIVKELHFDQKTNYLFQIARDFMVLKLYRKEVMFKGYYAFDLLFKEIGKRFGYTLQQLRYCLPGEIIQILQGEKISKGEINKRINSYFVHAFIRGKDYFYYGKRAKQYLKNNLYQEKIDTSLTEVRGMSAYIGQVSGIAKIVNKASEMNKVKKGDILVSIATSPTVLPAMKKASAFVTDTGGITCHAAIVARELKKPCVIGTEIATKIFKDGDKVEVDAMKGVVKKI